MKQQLIALKILKSTATDRSRSEKASWGLANLECLFSLFHPFNFLTYLNVLFHLTDRDSKPRSRHYSVTTVP